MTGWLLLPAAAFFVTGATCAWWGQRNIDPEFAYAGVLLILVALIIAALAGCAWLFASITS